MPNSHDNTYELVFFGKILPGADLQKVRNNAAKLFRAGPEQLDKLFSGSGVVLKNNLNQLTAETYLEKLKTAGLICTLRPMNTKPVETPEKVETSEKVSAPTSEPQSVSQPDSTKKDWSLAPVGADVNPHEPEPIPPMPDTSQFSLKEQQGYMFDLDDTPAPPVPNTSHITLE